MDVQTYYIDKNVAHMIQFLVSLWNDAQAVLDNTFITCKCGKEGIFCIVPPEIYLETCIHGNMLDVGL